MEFFFFFCVFRFRSTGNWISTNIFWCIIKSLSFLAQNGHIECKNRIISLFASIDLFFSSVWYRSCSWAAFQRVFRVLSPSEFIFLGFFFRGDWGGGWRKFNKLPFWCCFELKYGNPSWKNCKRKCELKAEVSQLMVSNFLQISDK